MEGNNHKGVQVPRNLMDERMEALVKECMASVTAIKESVLYDLRNFVIIPEERQKLMHEVIDRCLDAMTSARLLIKGDDEVVKKL